MNYTPGPWEVIEMHGSRDLYIESRHKPGWNEFVFASMIPYGPASRKELKANARLMAAAPELLYALKVVAEYANKYNSNVSGHEHAYDLAQKAIAKATGKAVK